MLQTFAQNDNIPTFKTATRSALVWDENGPENPAASTIRDPLTGNDIHRLSYAGIEVSSNVGYEKASRSEAERRISYLTVVANNTGSDVIVQYGGANVDGRSAPLFSESTGNDTKKKERTDASESGETHCFRGGSTLSVFSIRTSTQTFTIRPKTAVAVLFATKDPRDTALLCSMDGCHMTGTLRYSITVNHRDYVFVWPGHSIVYCGK
jgi:hypothetical protein